jgi:hypothetical protein
LITRIIISSLRGSWTELSSWRKYLPVRVSDCEEVYAIAVPTWVYSADNFCHTEGQNLPFAHPHIFEF